MLKQVVLATAVAGTMLVSTGCSKQVESADLGKVLDVFVHSMDTFESSAAEGAQEASDAVMKEFTQFTAANLNNPSFTTQPVGLELKDDGMFEGFEDKNSNSTRDSGEETSFTVEIDTENSRLIATDMSGESTGARFSGASFLAGAIIGNLLARQRKAGGRSFKNRNVKSRSAYASSRSSGSSARSKSFSGSHSSGK